MPVCQKRWYTVPLEEGVAQALSEDRTLDTPFPIACLLAGRGISTVEEAELFLNPRLSRLSDPFLLPGMAGAVERLRDALVNGRRIAVFGDYDVDGVTSCALLAGVLRRLGGTVETCLPDRLSEGYGLSVAALERCLAKARPELLLTADCGTCDHEAVAMARRAGVEIVVTDHHEPSGPLSDAPIVNPKLGDNAELHPLAGVGVAFKLCHALLKEIRDRNPEHPPPVDLREWLDLVALGTVADVVPLTGENRALARHGLARMNGVARPGLEALKEVARVKDPVDAYDVAFLLGPRLNAAGRLGDAGKALALLMETDCGQAAALARELDSMNSERKSIEQNMCTEAMAQIDAGFDPATVYGLVAAGRGWHPGAIGIVASRVCDAYGRPAVVISIDEQGCARGSCRGMEGLDLVEVLESCSELLKGFGGHRAAAGVTLAADRVDEFRERFNRECVLRMEGKDLQPLQRIDAWIGLHQANADLLHGMERLRPFGQGNPVPNWAARGVRVVGAPRTVGKTNNHLKLELACGSDRAEAVGFNMGGREVPQDEIDVVFRLRANNFRGGDAVELHLQDFRASKVEAAGER